MHRKIQPKKTNHNRTRLLTDNQDEIQKVIKEIMEIGSKELVAIKIPARTNAEEIRKEIGIKIAKQAKVRDFKNLKTLT